MRRVFGSLGFKLFLWIFVLLVVVYTSFAFISIQRTSEAWVESVEQQAGQTCAVIERAISYGMLLNRKDDVYANLRNIAQEPGIDAIRIYDKQGLIVFSTRDEERNKRVDRNAEACVICHAENQTRPLDSVPQTSRTRTYRDANGTLMLGRIHPIENSPQCSSGPCHAHPPTQSVLGVLDLKMSIAAIDQGKKRSEQTLLYSTLLMALVGGVSVALFIWRFVRVPVRKLTEGTRRIAAGDLESRIEVGEAAGEMSTLARAFNQMTRQLAQARDQKLEWERELEEAVRRKTEELNRAHGQMLHLEKMASLGKLSATVAHELNNPLAGILVYAKLVARELEEDERSGDERGRETRRYVEVIRQESARCGDIVRNLLAFARQSKPRLAELELNPVIERSLMTVQHLVKLAGVETRVTPIEGDDRMVGDANQLQQVFVALLVNAVEAMPNGGCLSLSGSGGSSVIEIRVEDTGVGIPSEVRPHIFEPFVSTKGEEKGVGLGLAVAYGIIRRHEGSIEVESEPGAGAKFTVVLPRLPPAERAPSDSGA